MKRTKIAVILFFAIAVAGFCFEGGGLVKTGIGFDINKKSNANNTVDFNHHDGISLWAKQNIDKDAKYNFSIQGSYLFNLSKLIAPNKKNSEFQNILDIDLLKFSFLIPLKDSDIYMDAGRFGISDITGSILNQNLDGFLLSYESYKKMNFSTHFAIAYTGLLNAYTNPMYGVPGKTQLYALAPGYIALNGLFHIPLGKYRHAVNLEANSFIKPTNNVVSKTYFTALFNGPIYSSLFFIVSGTGELVTNSVGISGNFAVTADIAYYFYERAGKVGVKTQWFSKNFQTFTVTNTSKVKTVLAKDLWKTNLYFSIKPITDLTLATSFNIFCKGSKNSGKSIYEGFEWDFSTAYALLSDIYMGFDCGVFIDSKKVIDTNIKLKAMLSF